MLNVNFCSLPYFPHPTQPLPNNPIPFQHPSNPHPSPTPPTTPPRCTNSPGGATEITTVVEVHRQVEAPPGGNNGRAQRRRDYTPLAMRGSKPQTKTVWKKRCHRQQRSATLPLSGLQSRKQQPDTLPSTGLQPQPQKAGTTRKEERGG